MKFDRHLASVFRAAHEYARCYHPDQTPREGISEKELYRAKNGLLGAAEQYGEAVVRANDREENGLF